MTRKHPCSKDNFDTQHIALVVMLSSVIIGKLRPTNAIGIH